MTVTKESSYSSEIRVNDTVTVKVNKPRDYFTGKYIHSRTRQILAQETIVVTKLSIVIITVTGQPRKHKYITKKKNV